MKIEHSESAVYFLILAHDEPRQLASLIHALTDSRPRFVIHVDRRENIDDYKRFFPGRSDIHFLENRQRIFLAGFEMVAATLEGLRIIARHGEPFSHVVLR